MVPATARRPARDIRVRKPVPEHRDPDLKAVNIAALVESGLISNPRDGVKILGNGEITKKLNVKVTAASETAKAKIEAAGGTIEVV